MATIMGTAAAAETLKERFNPAIAAIEENVRQARLAIRHARHAAEDTVGEAQLEVRRHPLAAVTVAAGVGVFVGCLVGVALGWRLASPGTAR
jgi:ElaB/YqjD/DUF883 family membrane-anchored ribosome-binding protein